MTTERETFDIVRSWLEEGRTRLPDHVLDAVLAQIPETPQRRPRWPARRIVDMQSLARYSMAAAAVVLVAIVGLNVLSAPSPDGNTGASPSTAPTPSPWPPAVPSGALEPGRYRWTWDSGHVSFEVREGWSANGNGIAKRADSPAEFGLSAWLPGTASEVTHVYADACRSAGQLQPLRLKVTSLVRALEDQAGTTADATTLSIGGAAGSRVELRQMPALDRSACRHGAEGPLQVWADEAETTFFALGDGYWGVVYAFDVDDGRRIVFSGTFGPESTDADVAELESIVASLEFATGSLPALRLPGTTASPAGEYGWEGGPGSGSGMHRVIERDGRGREATALIFRVGADCLAASEEQQVPVRVAGLDGVSVEPYEPPVQFSDGRDLITRAHALAVGDRTLCVFLTWRATTTEAELEAAERVLDTLRAEPIGEHRIRITFTLEEGWDVG